MVHFWLELANIITELPKSDQLGKAWDERPLSPAGHPPMLVSETSRCALATVNCQDER